MIIDSQAHLWEANRPDRPWPTDRTDRPQREIPLEPPEILAAMDEIGVDRLVIVPPIWIGEGNESAIEAATEHPDRLAIMGRFDLWDPGHERIEHWLDQPGMLGIRMSYPAGRGEAWLDPETFAWFWSAAERLGIPIMLLVLGKADRVGPIAERHPGLKLILDHMALQGGPADDPDRELVTFGANFEEVISLARHENVSVKFSGLGVYSSESYPYPKMTPYLERAFDAYGPRRVMWGSDYTRLLRSGKNTYQQCLDHVRNLPFLGAEDREWVLGRTCATILDWPIPTTS